MKSLLMTLLCTVTIPNPLKPLEDPLQQLDLLIENTTLSLESEKILRRDLESYLQLKEAVATHADDRDLTLRLVKKAHAVRERILELYLIHTFDPQFVSELNFLSEVAEKSGTK